MTELVWALIAGALGMLLAVGLKEAAACLPKQKKKKRHGDKVASYQERFAAQQALRRTGRRKIGLAVILAAVTLAFFIHSPEAPRTGDALERLLEQVMRDMLGG
jgi:hypothetical protein